MNKSNFILLFNVLWVALVALAGKFELIYAKTNNDDIVAIVAGFCLQEKAGLVRKVSNVPVKVCYGDPFGQSTGMEKLAVGDAGQCMNICMSDPDCRSFCACERRGTPAVDCSLSRASYLYGSFADKLITPKSSYEQFLQLQEQYQQQQEHLTASPVVSTIKFDIRMGSSDSFGRMASEQQLTLGKSYEIEGVMFADEADSYDETEEDKFMRVTVTKNADCGIYNKIYLDYFSLRTFGFDDGTKKENPRKVFTNVIMLPFRSVEACARYCVHRNLRSRRYHFDQISSTLSKMDIEMMKEYPDEIVVKQKDARERLLCLGIHYIESTRLANQTEELLREVDRFVELTINQEKDYGHATVESYMTTEGDSKRPPEMGGYCVVQSADERARVQNQIDLGPIQSEMYDFNYFYFYSEVKGLSLMSSSKSNEVRVAMASLEQEGPISFADYSVAHHFSLASNNHQMRRMMQGPDITGCALSCLTQIGAPWPACRSFDVIIRREGDNETVECLLNTMTLGQINKLKKLNLLRTDPNRQDINNTKSAREQVRRLHYEPRVGLGLERSLFAMSDHAK